MRGIVAGVVAVGSVLGSLVLLGCRTLETPARPSEPWAPPAATSALSETAPWTDLRGAAEAWTNRPLALADLLDAALLNNPDTRAAWEQTRAAKAQAEQARSAWYPQASAELTGSRSRTDAGQGEAGALDDTPYGPSATLTWMLLDAGGRNARVEQAYQALLASNLTFNRALQDILLAVQQAYYGLDAAKGQLDAAETDVKTAEESLRAARQRMDAGLSTQLDVLQAQSDYDNALYNREDARGGVRQATAVLCRLIGLPPDTDLAIAGQTNNPPAAESLPPMRELIVRALDGRPDLAAQRANLEAAEAARRAARSDLWPTLGLSAQASKTWHDYSGNDNASALQDNEYTYAGGLVLQWDFFNGFYKQQALRKAEADLAAARESLRSAELAAAADVWTNFYALDTARQKLTFSQASFQSADAAYQLALESYHNGLKSILDLLQAQSQLALARSRVIAARQDVFVTIAGLAHALGALERPDGAQLQSNKGVQP